MHHAAADVACWHAVDAMASSPEAESASDEAADGSSDEATRWDSILRAAEMSPRKGTPWESAPATSRHITAHIGSSTVMILAMATHADGLRSGSLKLSE